MIYINLNYNDESKLYLNTIKMFYKKCYIMQSRNVKYVII